jgi:predicted dehydrogenase
VCFPLLLPGDIRYRLDLAGGAMMDAGCYAVNMLRALAGSEPAVVSARAKLQSPGVDRAMSAQLLFPGGVDARFTCSMRSRHVLRIQLRAVGEDGRLDVINPFANGWNRLTIRASGVRTAERVKGDTTYTYQLRAFLAAVENGVPPLTGPAQAVANMAVIDAVYGAAGLEVRQPTPA